MTKRDSKGRFLKGRKGGMGTIITMRRGMGALPGGKLGEAVIPGLVGGGVTALVTLLVRQMVDPNTSESNRMIVRWAWLIGHGTGIAASLALLLFGGTPAGIASFVAATSVGLGFFGQDLLLARTGGSITAAVASPGTAGYRGRPRGTAAIVPEYGRALPAQGMGAMVMEPVGANGRRSGTLGGPYGQTVALGGLNTGAFGTSPFRA